MKRKLSLVVVIVLLTLLAVTLSASGVIALAQLTPNLPGQPTVSRDVVSPSGYDLTPQPRRALNAASGLVASTTTTSTVYLPLVKNDQPSMPGMVFIPVHSGVPKSYQIAPSTSFTRGAMSTISGSLLDSVTCSPRNLIDGIRPLMV